MTLPIPENISPGGMLELKFPPPGYEEPSCCYKFFCFGRHKKKIQSFPKIAVGFIRKPQAFHTIDDTSGKKSQGATKEKAEICFFDVLKKSLGSQASIVNAIYCKGMSLRDDHINSISAIVRLFPQVTSATFIDCALPDAQANKLGNLQKLRSLTLLKNSELTLGGLEGIRAHNDRVDITYSG